MKALRGKRVGSAQSARGIQLGVSGTAARCGRIPSRDLSPALAGPRRAHFLRGGAPRPALGRLGRARGRRWLAAPAASFTAPSRPDLAVSPGAADHVLAAPSLPPFAVGGTGPPRPRRDCRPGRTVLSAPQPRRAAQGGDRPTTEGATGQRRCRLPTRPVLKHGPRSLTHARVRGCRRNPAAQ